MKHAFWFLALLSALVLLPVAKAAPQPHMKAALELLRTAKDADNPRPSLIAARKHLVEAKNNKGGAVAQALKDVNEAIALATTGSDKDKIKQKINAAIANVQNGMGNAN
jgi:hypothetical protein